MILSGPEIERLVESGDLIIDPFNSEQINPNSYNYRLGSTIKVAPSLVLDPMDRQKWESITIPDGGFVLLPERLYLGSTVERIGSKEFVTTLFGRSSMGRLGLYLQVHADLGHLGAIHHWTLEMVVVQPLRVYAGMIIGQVTFWEPTGERQLYQGVYANSAGPLEYQVELTR